jgi:hypothetical protein
MAPTPNDQLASSVRAASLHVCHIRRAILLLFVAVVSAAIANAQCPPVGADTACGTVITVIATGNTPCPPTGCTSIANNQGPYDTIDDTLVGVVNASNFPIATLILSSGPGGADIFGFDGDGICGLSPLTGQPYVPGPPACPYGPTGYEGPGVSFSNISADFTTGTVTFSPPIPAHGGTAYFSLENALGQATACSDVINGAVSQPPGSGTTITSAFTPNLSYTLAQAAQLCGFIDFDWQQTITSLPLPSPFFAAGSTVPLSAPPPFNDPPPQGYAYQSPPNAVILPVYYNLFTTGSLSLTGNETATTLSFFDAPADPCLHGGSGLPCGGKTAPAGSKLAFTTHLVGITGALPGAGVLDTGIGFSWTDTYNGTSGGIAVTNSYRPVDPGSGTGGVTITQVNETTTYQYPKSIGVIGINGNPVSPAPSTSTLLTAAQIKTVASGLVYSRATQMFSGTVTITNVSNSSIVGPFQIVLDSLTAGVTLANATSTFGGWPFITVPAVGTLAPGQSATVTLQLKDPSNATINFSPIPYSGSFN